MQLIDHRVGDALSGIGVGICIPPGGIGGFHIQDHCPQAVDTGGSGVGVTGFPAAVHQIGIVVSCQVLGIFRCPGALNGRLHLDLQQPVIHCGRAAAVDVDRNAFGSRCPQAEARAAAGAGDTQVGACVGIVCLKFGGVVKLVHGRSASLRNVGERDRLGNWILCITVSRSAIVSGYSGKRAERSLISAATGPQEDRRISSAWSRWVPTGTPFSWLDRV